MTENVWIVLIVFLAFVLWWGEPDMHDALVSHFMPAAAEHP